MLIKAQNRGDLRELMGKESELLAQKVTAAAHYAGLSTQRTLRVETGEALGRGVANAWRLNMYPANEPSANPAAYIWSKAPNIIDAFDRGAVIRARNRKWLAIPLPEAGKVRGTGRGVAKALGPLQWQQRKGIKLSFVPIRSGQKALLVAERGSFGPKTRRLRQRKRAGFAGEVAVPIFLLVRSVKMPKLLSVDRHADGGLATLALELDKRLRQ